MRAMEQINCKKLAPYYLNACGENYKRVLLFAEVLFEENK
jgi:hypothetical protein